MLLRPSNLSSTLIFFVTLIRGPLNEPGKSIAKVSAVQRGALPEQAADEIHERERERKKAI